MSISQRLRRETMTGSHSRPARSDASEPVRPAGPPAVEQALRLQSLVGNRAATPVLQRQTFGLRGGRAIGDPTYNQAAPQRPIDNVEFQSVGTANEIYPTREAAFFRAAATFGGTAAIWRTYHAFGGAMPPIQHNLGTQWVFSGAATPLNSQGRYYDFGGGRLVVEHVVDPLAQYWDVNAAGGHLAAHVPAPHFHMATYATPDYHTTGPSPIKQANQAPPLYAQLGPAHHIYY